MIQLIISLIIYVFLLRKFKNLNFPDRFLNYNSSQNSYKYQICDEILCF